MAQIDSMVLGPVMTNCYLLWHHNHVLIVDPATKSGQIKQLIEMREGIVDGIFLTHGHFDHIGGVDAYARLYQCPVYINDPDLGMLSDPYRNASGLGEEVIVKSEAIGLQPGKNQINEFTFTLIDAPGHTEGSCLMIWGDAMICGDVLFQGSIGRTDLIGGSNTKMYQTLEMVKTLDPDLTIYPGHGPKTSLAQELKHNPFLI